MQTTKYILEVTSVINKPTLTDNDLKKIVALLNDNSTEDLVFNICKYLEAVEKAICPKCGSKNTEVGEVEDEPDGAYLRCDDCGYVTEEFL